jgi:hypothetical protein
VFRSRLCKPSCLGVNFLYKPFMCHIEVGWNGYNSVNKKKESDVSVMNNIVIYLTVSKNAW